MLSHHPEIIIAGEAATAAEAGVLFSTVEFDLTFLDMVMPEANGFSLIGRVPPTAAVVFVTAHERLSRNGMLVELTGVAKTFRLGRAAAVRVNRPVSGSP